jgi:inner membrane protein
VDNLTHSLVGYTLARAGVGRSTPAPALTLVLASNIPDVDIVTVFTGGPVSYLDAHRGFTHGPVGCVVLAAVTAAAVVAGSAWRARRRGTPLHQPARVLARTFGLAVLGAALHALMDLPTSYGTRVLSPFVETWYAMDWMPIIDIYLWGVLAAGVIAMYVRPSAARHVALAVLALMLADYTGRALLHASALRAAAARTAEGAAAPCAASPTLVRHPTVIEASGAGPGSCIQAAALPTFLSPFRWRAIRQYPNGYELSERSVRDESTPQPRVWIPSEAGPLIARARATRTARVFLDFSRFPAARVVQTGPEMSIVRFVDVRFVGNPVAWDQDARARSPFVATVALGAAGQILEERLGN